MDDNIIQLKDELEVLKSFMPSALREGTLLVEFKSDTDIIPAAILTLNNDEIMGSKPEEDQTDYGTWCFNFHRKFWVWLDYSKIDKVQPWPVQEFDTILTP